MLNVNKKSLWLRRVSPVALLVMAAISSSLSPIARADAGWTSAAHIAEVNPTARHYYQFRLLDIESPAGCKQENGFYQDYKSRGAEQMYQALLEAISANLKVKVFVTGGCNLKGFAEVSSVVVSR